PTSSSKPPPTPSLSPPSPSLPPPIHWCWSVYSSSKKIKVLIRVGRQAPVWGADNLDLRHHYTTVPAGTVV
ncbi:hypothetical protein TIFTF001_040800, partial [Ficus carica]